MLLRWEQRHLSEASGVPLQTIKGLEIKAGPISAQTRTLDALRDAFEAAGVQFIAENGGGAGVRMREPAPKEPPMPRKPRAPRKTALTEPAEKPLVIGRANSKRR
ncbi:hypothetical protein Ms3S1_16770 [Methylosinus sp. 3S-1]